MPVFVRKLHKLGIGLGITFVIVLGLIGSVMDSDVSMSKEGLIGSVIDSVSMNNEYNSTSYFYPDMKSGSRYVDAFLKNAIELCDDNPSDSCNSTKALLQLQGIGYLKNHLDSNGEVTSLDKGCRSLDHTARVLDRSLYNMLEDDDELYSVSDLDFYDLMAKRLQNNYYNYDVTYDFIKAHEELRLFAYESWFLSDCKDNFGDSLYTCTSSHPHYDPDTDTCDFTK